MRHNIDALYADASETGPRHASQGGQNNNDYWRNFLDTHPGYTPPTAHWHPNVPYPNAPHDGGAQDRANSAAATSGLEQANNYQYYVDNAPTLWDKLIPAIAIGMSTAGIGSAVGGAASAAASGAGYGATAATAAGGAAGGATAGGLSSALQGGDNFLKNLLIGGVMGGVGGGFKASGWGGDATSYLTSQGVPPEIAKAIVASGVGAGKGALGGELSGRGAGAGASGGALDAGTGSVVGSIFNSGSTIFGSNNPSAPTSTPSNPSMTDNLDYITPTGQYATFDPTTGGFTGGGSGGFDPGSIPFMDPNGPSGASAPTGGWLPTDAGGNVYSGNAPGMGGNTVAGWLSKLLGVGGNGAGGSNGNMGSLLQRLFGYGAAGAGGALQHNAAVGAAGQYANQAKFNPFNVSGAGGSTTFGPHGITSNLSRDGAAQRADLSGVTDAAADYLQKGNGADVNDIFNDLQKSQRDSNNRMFQSNLDSQFGNGVLASTAGQYQTQGALDAINKMTTNNHITAQNLGSQIQQDQLRQLTAGLNGQNQMDQMQLDQGKLGLQGGTEQSYANSQAYKPWVSANSTSPWGDLLANMGGNSINSGNNDQLIQYIRHLMGG